MKLSRILLSCTLVLGLTVAQAGAEPMKLNLVSGPVTGGWYVGMGVVGKIITSAYPDTEITMLPGGSTVNPIRLDRGQADIGILQIAMGSVARKGEAPFKAPVKNVAQLVCWNDLSPINIVVREDLGVNSIEELRDRKVPVRLAVGMKGGGGDSYGRWLFGEYGFTFKDIEDWGGQVYFNNYDDMTNLAKDGLVDMIVWLGRGESWFLAEISKDIKMKWLPVSDEVAEKMNKRYGMVRASVSGDFYSGRVGGKDIPSVAEMTGLSVRADMPEEEVYKITKAICEGRDELVNSFAAWGSFTVEGAAREMAFPLHPGAARYYKEIGVLK